MYLEVLEKCRELSIRLALKEGKLVVSDKQKNLTTELKQALRDNKAEIVAWLEQAASGQAGGAKKAARAEDYPLSFAQQRLWFIDQLTEQGTHYNVPMSLRVKGPFDLAIVKRVVETLYERHQVLRTTFKMKGELPVQVVHDDYKAELPIIDLTEVPEPAKSEQLQQIVTDNFATPFDLASDLMMRASVVKLDKDDVALGVVCCLSFIILPVTAGRCRC